MNILIAMDSLKGSLSSMEANNAIAAGLTLADTQLQSNSVPIADGGEGTVEALVQATNGSYRKVTVTGPLGKPVEAEYGFMSSGKTAVIEIAEACGLPLSAKDQLNPLHATTYGVGELILDAIEKGSREFIIGLGGSASTDAGIGMLKALGFEFYNQKGNLIVEHGGIQLSDIAGIDHSNVPETVKSCKFHIACDVTNPLYGNNGAAFVFGPQKGATEEEIMVLDNGLRQFAAVAVEQLGMDLQSIPGAGAAGGLGAAFAGFLNAELLPGVELILKNIKFEERLKDIDLVITGEGKLDDQTSMGKAPAGIAAIAKKYDIPVIAFSGDVSKGSSTLHKTGIDAYFSIVSGPAALEVAMDPTITRSNLSRSAEQIGRLLRVFKS